MKFIFLLWSILQLTSQNPTRHWTLKPNVLVLEVTGGVGTFPLKCLHLADESIEIFWKVNGQTLESKGNTLLVEFRESIGGGNYSCHRDDGSLLNHTEVLLHESGEHRMLKKPGKEDLNCSAVNYSGHFRCSFEWDPDRIGQVAFIQAQRLSQADDPYLNEDLRCAEASDGQWTCVSDRSNVSCSVDGDQRGITCLDARHCPYAEETGRVHIILYLRNDFLLENYSKHFYLSEIVKPEKVQIRKVNDTTIEWTYPSSWASPYTYFPLTFEVVQIQKKWTCDDIQLEKIQIVNCTDHDKCSCEIKRNIRTVCIRAKDALSDAEWSECSCVRVKPKKTKRRTRRL